MLNEVQSPETMRNGQVEDHQSAVDKVNREAQALGQAILKSEVYTHYLRARDEFRMDESAKEAAREYNTLLNDYQNRAQWGGITPEDEQKIEEARKKAMENKVLSDYYSAKENLIDFYQELNASISEKLKFNFAGLAAPAGGCCG